MATYTASAAQSTQPAKTLRVGLTAVKSVYSFDGLSTTPGTIFQMVKVPAGAKVVYMDWQPRITGQYTLHIGDSVNDQRFFSHATTSLGDGVARPLNAAMTFYQYSADDVISMKISLVSVVTVGGAMYMNVVFSMDA